MFIFSICDNFQLNTTNILSMATMNQQTGTDRVSRITLQMTSSDHHHQNNHHSLNGQADPHVYSSVLSFISELFWFCRICFGEIEREEFSNVLITKCPCRCLLEISLGYHSHPPHPLSICNPRQHLVGPKRLLNLSYLWWWGRQETNEWNNFIYNIPE